LKVCRKYNVKVAVKGFIEALLNWL